MARLNMPPAPSENISLDRLRRKFAEQNQVLVKSNTRQSLQIQKLNNECARLLSENLDLRGQVLRLEKEVQDNRARRIADHALEVKARLEEQLVELNSTLAKLGLEPPRKRHLSPASRTIAQPRKSVTVTSPPRKKSRDLPQDSEALAFREGRLPPIQENKSYPRATLSEEEIMALCEEATDTTNSPDLGPPPVSRYVDELAETDSPSKKGAESTEMSPDPPQAVQPSESSSQRKPVKESPLRKVELVTRLAADVKPGKEATPLATVTLAARGGKRKFGDENEPPKAAKSFPGKENIRSDSQDKVVRDLQKQRSFKELPANRREKTSSAQAAGRKPLSVKSSNEDLLSPKKATKPPKLDEVTSSKARALKESLSKERLDASRIVPRIEIPASEVPPVAAVLLDPETPSCSDTAMATPDTPDRAGARDIARDTPPPADISSNGETSRPSRRARAAISYAEPNLRDKMRRPTKQLLDAVAGEGKYIHRPQKSDELGPASATKGGAQPGSIDRETVLSPLAEKKKAAPDGLPNTISTDRRKRPSATSRESIALPEQPEAADLVCRENRVRVGNHDVRVAVASKDYSSDIYDFSSSSPAADPKGRLEDGEGMSRPSSRNARRSSTALGKYTSVETIQATAKSRSSNLRKRASMVEPEKTQMLGAVDSGPSLEAYEGAAPGISSRDRISRRRSMML